LKILLSILRGQNQSALESGLSPADFDLDSLLPFRHKIETDYATSMRSCFVQMNIGSEHVAVESDLVYYQV
jgi:hypothetical protein